MLGHVALDEEGADGGIDTGRQQARRGVQGALRQRGRVVFLRQGVEVDHAVEGVGVLVGHPVAHRPQVVAEMQGATRLHP